jgi:NADH:ubiquinone oxidoreductase subunit 5 (subunit L)/multisubunit Na+/H+ antiporter MnhA subunit
MDLMGGLARSMPVTALVTLVGAVALAGLPPLNGFLGELVLYMGLARSATGIGWPALAMPALAMTGALAVVAMVKVYGGAFLGEARQPMKPHDPPLAMRATMGILAAACIVVVPAAVTLGPALDRVTLAFAFRPIPSLATLVPLGNVTMLLLAAAALAGGVIYWARRSRRGAASPQGTAGTWACGYAMPSPRIQYTPTSFSELVMGLFRGFLSLREFRPTLQGVFPRRSLFAFAVRDPVLDRAAVPVIGVIERSATWLRLTQQGNVQVYVLYIVLALLGLLWVG